MDFKILENKAKCNLCGDIIESKHTHDFKWCKCKSIAVDGGQSYLRRLGELENITDMSKTISYRDYSKQLEKEIEFYKEQINGLNDELSREHSLVKEYDRTENIFTKRINKIFKYIDDSKLIPLEEKEAIKEIYYKNNK